VTGGSAIGTVGGAVVGGALGNKVGEDYDRRNR
jgi:outer membrane lipoprotein SlyB